MVNDPKLRKRTGKGEKDKKNNETPKIPEKDNYAVRIKANPYKYGLMPSFSGQQLLSRGVVMLGVIIYAWYFSKQGHQSTLAKQSKIYGGRGQHVKCDSDYLNDVTQYPGCTPKKCGRYVSDNIVTEYEVNILLWLAERGMSVGGSSGGASIMDLHSGALSYKETFINFYKNVKGKIITSIDLAVYQMVRTKIQHAIAEFFGLDVNSLYLTHPTFFSKLTNKEAITAHDEYWLVHIDKHTYESFHYTSLLYLNDYDIDFKGGRFVYVNHAIAPRQNVSVEPRKGRVSMFTSGAENPHYVERVTEGERYAMTISFTCDQTKKINDPVIQ